MYICMCIGIFYVCMYVCIYAGSYPCMYDVCRRELILAIFKSVSHQHYMGASFLIANQPFSS